MYQQNQLNTNTTTLFRRFGMSLTVLKVKNSRAVDKDIKLSDSGGLFLLIKANGSKYWRLAYRFQGKQKTLSFGVYPEVSLLEAREKSLEAKKHLSNGTDPSTYRKIAKLTSKVEFDNSFESVASEWFDKQKKSWVDSHTVDVKRRLEANIFPKIGKLPINQILPIQVLEIVRSIEKREAFDLSHRVLGVFGQVFRYGVASGRCVSDPTRDLKGVLTPHVKKSQNAVKPADFPALMLAISRYSSMGNLQTQLALQLLALTFVRTGELIGAKWNEFDFEKKLWKIPASRMKMKREHLVPLAPQSILILEKLRDFSINSEFVFSGRNPKNHISNNTLLFAIYKLGYKGRMSGHGFRAVASTILNENNFRSDIIERQLAHLDGNSVRAAYNRAEYFKERILMMNWWACYIVNSIKK